MKQAEKVRKKADLSQLTPRVRKAVIPLLEERGYKIYDVLFEKEGAMKYLRVHLYDGNSGTLSMAQCDEVTQLLNGVCDGVLEDYPNIVDILEIGSPGITRRLRLPEHFKAAMREQVRIVDGKSGRPEVYAGLLTEYTENPQTVKIVLRDETEMSMSVRETTRVYLNPDLTEFENAAGESA